MAHFWRRGLLGRLESLISKSDSRLAVRIRSKITWNKLYHIISYTKSSLWVIPIFAILIQFFLVRLFHFLDALILWRIPFPIEIPNVEGAETMLQTVITLNLSFLVFTFGSLLVAIQVASAQLTPRIIATTLLRDNVVRFSVGLFVFTLIFAVATQGRMDKIVHQLPYFICGFLGLFSMATFLYLIDYASRLLRPVSIVGRVGQMGIEVIDHVYLSPTKGTTVVKKRDLGLPAQIVNHEGAGRIILALNITALVAMAESARGVIEFVPRVGDFLGTDDPLFHLYGGAALIDVKKLRACVAFGPERTIEQDPTFAFRIIVDIALKALSPAINDPTTSVLAMDQLQRLLRKVGQRHLHDDEIRDKEGYLRLILRTPDWADFVNLSFTEIRHYGACNVQVARRLRAVIENLIGSLPEHRHPELLKQLELLDRTVEKSFSFKEDLALARIADTQGL